MARRAGVSVETLRYYERRRLLPEPPRSAGGHRRYDEDAVRFLRAIKDAQAIGFTLAEIEEYLRAVKRGRVPAPEAMRMRMKPVQAGAVQHLEAHALALQRRDRREAGAVLRLGKRQAVEVHGGGLGQPVLDYRVEELAAPRLLLHCLDRALAKD